MRVVLLMHQIRRVAHQLVRVDQPARRGGGLGAIDGVGRRTGPHTDCEEREQGGKPECHDRPHVITPSCLSDAALVGRGFHRTQGAVDSALLSRRDVAHDGDAFLRLHGACDAFDRGLAPHLIRGIVPATC